MASNVKIASFLAILLQYTLFQNSSVVVAQYARSQAVEKCNMQVWSGWSGTWKSCNDVKGYGTITHSIRENYECADVRKRILDSNDKHCEENCFKIVAVSRF